MLSRRFFRPSLFRVHSLPRALFSFSTDAPIKPDLSDSKIIPVDAINLVSPPTESSSFSHILGRGCPFVDKTYWIGALFQKHDRAFLARPRKWGKSTLVSTMEMILRGGQENREKFKDLNIVKYGHIFPLLDWEERPVLVFDFSNVQEKLENRSFRRALIDLLKVMGQKYEIDLSPFEAGENLKFVWSQFLQRLREKSGMQVSVLVDEYDSPIVQALNWEKHSKQPNYRLAEENRLAIRDFFTTLKAENANTFRCFVTGLNKFSMTGLFSGANDFKDITFSRLFSHIAGYTSAEIELYYGSLLDRLYTALELNQEEDKDNDHLKKKKEFWNRLTKEYGGYSWTGDDTNTDNMRLFNPWDINNCLSDQSIVPYWTKNGLSSRLLFLLNSDALHQMEWVDREYSLSHMESLVELPQFIEAARFDPVRLLVLNGYLTVKRGHYGDGDWMMSLGFPNELIAKYVCYELVKLRFGVSDHEFQSQYSRALRACLDRGNILALFLTLRPLFARTPYHISHGFSERHIHSLLFQLLSAIWGPKYVEAETTGQWMRVDLVVETNEHANVLELKVTANAKQRRLQGLSGGALVKEQRKLAKEKKGVKTTANIAEKSPPMEASLLTSDIMKAHPERMCPELQEAMTQLQVRQYEHLASARGKPVRRFAIVYHPNLVLMDAVEIDAAGKVAASVWDDEIDVTPMDALVSLSDDKKVQENRGRGKAAVVETSHESSSTDSC